MSRFARLLFVFSTVASVAGCAGYQLGGVPPQEMVEITSIAVPTFHNDTQEPRIDVLFTNAVIGELQVDGTYQIGSLESADAVLQGTITRIERRQQRSVPSNTIRSRELGVRVQFSYLVRRNDATKELLLAGQLQGASEFFPLEEFEISERPVFPDAARDLALQLTAAITEGY
ncbi:MAG: LptE family protein [Verrucomicrobiota bacterium]